MADEESGGKQSTSDEGVSLVDDLGVVDLRRRLFQKAGRLFSTAGRHSPVAELQKDYLVIHPSDKPLVTEEVGTPITINVNDKGIMLDELGNLRRIVGAKYNGQMIYVLGETLPDTTKNLVGWQDKDGKIRKLIYNEAPLTASGAYKLRNKTHNGEIKDIPELTSE